MRCSAFTAMDNEERFKWARGSMLLFPNGLYSPVRTRREQSSHRAALAIRMRIRCVLAALQSWCRIQRSREPS